MGMEKRFALKRVRFLIGNARFSLNRISEIRRTHPVFRIAYKSRKSNHVADSFAKQGVLRERKFVAWL